jgi:hypothetical protein
MKNTQDLNKIYFAIGELKIISQILKNENPTKYWEYCKNCEYIAEDARKSYDNLREICK